MNSWRASVALRWRLSSCWRGGCTLAAAGPTANCCCSRRQRRWQHSSTCQVGGWVGAGLRFCEGCGGGLCGCGGIVWYSVHLPGCVACFGLLRVQREQSVQKEQDTIWQELCQKQVLVNSWPALLPTAVTEHWPSQRHLDLFAAGPVRVLLPPLVTCSALHCLIHLVCRHNNITTKNNNITTGVFDLRPALEAAAAGGILNARQLEGVATSMESAFTLKAQAAAAAVDAAAAAAATTASPKQQQQQQQYLFPCLAQLAAGIQERELRTLRAIRSCIG